MGFTNSHIRKVIKYVSPRWLSPRICFDRMVTQWDALKYYFVSNFDLNDNVCHNEENDNTKSREKK